MKDLKELTKAEDQVMQILWKLQKGFVKDIMEGMPSPKPAYNTVSTIVRILETKGFVDHKAYGKTHEYFPLITKEKYTKFYLNNLIKGYFNGSFQNLVSFFAKENKMDANDLEKLLNELKKSKAMNTLINYLLEANLGLCLFLIVYEIFLRNETDFRLKRGFMLIAIFVSVIFPLLHFNTPVQVIPSLGDFVPPTWLPEVVIGADGNPSGKETHTNFDTWFLFNSIYGLGVLAGLTLFLIRLGTLLKMIYHATPFKLDKVLIIESTENKSAFSFFQFIFIGQADQLSNLEKEQIIHHERVHVQQLHSFDMLLMNVLSVFFWFNPVLKIYKKIFIQLHEFEADARAVENRDVNDYCSLLAKVALQSADFKLANHFSNSLTLKRIEMIRTLKSKIKWWKVLACASVIPVVFFIVACQDQVVNEVTEVAKGSSIALDIPQEVQQKYDELSRANPDKKFLVVETDENLKPKLDQLKLKLQNLDQSQISHIELITPKANPSEPMRTFAIIEYDEMTEKISESSKLEGEIFTIVEESAFPVGGVESVGTFIQQNLKYPAESRMKGIEGTVFVQFVVNTDGSLSDFTILKGVDPLLDAEALNVARLFPNWNPGKQSGLAVRQQFVLPIRFKLNNDTPPLEIREVAHELDIIFNSTEKGDKKVVTGKVLDESGAPLLGANIVIVGTTSGTTTDSNGNFSIEVPKANRQLAVSFVGYKTGTISF